MKYCLLICLTLSGLLKSQTAFSQSDSLPAFKKAPFFGMSLGLSHQKAKPQIVSPLKYKGISVNFAFSYFKQRKKSLTSIYINTIVGSIKNRRFSREGLGGRFQQAKAQLYRFEIGSTYLHHFKDFGNRYRLYLGGNFYSHTNLRFSTRWDNSAINYDQAFALGVSGKIDREYRFFKRKITLSYQIGFPLLAFVMRPEFSGVPDFIDHEKSFLKDAFQRGRWTSFNKFPHFKSSFEATWAIAEKNLIRFSYLWDYYSYPEPLTIQASGQTFLFTLITRLK